MTTYAKVITLSTDTKWIAYRKIMDWLVSHPDPEVQEQAKWLEGLLSEDVKMVQRSGSRTNPDGTTSIWISG